MNHPQEGVGYNEVTFMYTGGAVPHPPPSPPPRRRRLIPLRILVRAFVAASAVIGVLALLICLIYWPRTPRGSPTSRSSATTVPPRRSPWCSPTTSPRCWPHRTPTGARPSTTTGSRRRGSTSTTASIARAALPLPFQGTRRTDTVPVVLTGTGSSPAHVDLRPDAFPPHEKGVFPVDLMVDGFVRYRFGKLTTAIESKLTVECRLDLKLMVPSGWVDCANWS
ncbi:hypothetical protein PAHAL_5G079500 [Panicum hallii]|uniref:Late embryogenesis abundant protein LEA-2 subgroup domain-containing protein n=1 Tax=Panicum hallii TaxID=206008 RepID=A0A2S3HPQ8_9POAL|nr:hypothetical protein PAHAL_5G079500 [Panicum hallii]